MIIDNKKNDLAISNDFIYGLIQKNNKNTLKLLFHTLKNGETLNSSEKNVYLSLPLKDLYTTYNNSLANLRQDYKKIQRTLITLTNTNKNIKDTQLIKEIEYDLHNQRIILEISKVIYQEFKFLEEGRFSTININNLILLNNKHSIRFIPILEHLNGYSKDIAKIKVFTLRDLNNLFGTEYTTYKSFINGILKPIQKELSLYSNLTFIYNLNYDILKATKGRKPITSIKIILQENNQYQPTLF